MRRETREWVKKAEADYQSALLLHQHGKGHVDQVVFLCQQSAEKYLKSLLEEAGIAIPRVHLLRPLLKLLLPQHPELKRYSRGLSFLTRFAVAYRYPGEHATKRQVIAGLRRAGEIRSEVRLILKLKP
jgi:HEPN domain-containing protein